MTEQLLEVTHPSRRNERMGKLMFSLRQEYLHTVMIEAKSRGISVQELLRAVIIPDWFRYKDMLTQGQLTLETDVQKATLYRRSRVR